MLEKESSETCELKPRKGFEEDQTVIGHENPWGGNYVQEGEFKAPGWGKRKKASIKAGKIKRDIVSNRVEG